MATSEAVICNLGLNRIGNTAHIDSLTDLTEEARVSASLFPASVKKLLASNNWPFATRQVVLAPLTNVSRTNWLYTFNMPDDCLKVIGLVREGAVILPLEIRDEWDVVAREDGSGWCVVANLDEIEVQYIYHVTNPTAFPPQFADALSWLLAAEFSLAIKHDLKLHRDLYAIFEDKRREAAADLKNQREFHRLEPVTPSLRARG